MQPDDRTPLPQPAPPAPAPDERTLDLFAAIVVLPAAERGSALDRCCAGDAELRAAVTALLRDYDDPPPILTQVMSGATSAVAGVPVPGSTIGPYRIVEVIGRGGMAVVYRALQDRPQRTVALKVMSPGGSGNDDTQRFAREVEVLGLLQHPGICRIYGAGSIDLGPGFGETMYFAMEFVDGSSLTEFATAERLDAPALCDLVALVCDAVQHAHEHGVVHRDLKPGNILVARGPGGEAWPKVLDFGIARAIQADATPNLTTRTGMLLGTLPYMSPEQLNGSARNIDARSDVYSLGVLLYELLAGRLPLQFDDLPLAEVCRLAAHREPVPLGAVDRRWRGDLATIVHKALQKDREDRYDGASALGADLRRFLRHEPILARRPTPLYQLRRFAQRNRALVWSTAATMLALLLGLLGTGWLAAKNEALAGREREARQAAERASTTLRASLYRSQMRLGSEAMQAAGGVAQVRQIVDGWLPTTGEDDLRGFEWHLLWASSHREEQVFAVETTPQWLRWTRDGAELVTAHWRSLVRWDARTGAELGRQRSPVDPFAAAAVDATGRVGVQVVEPSVVAAIDLSTGKRGHRFVHAGEVHHCALSADGQLCVANGPVIGAIVWDVRSGRQLAALAGSWTGGVAFSPDGRWLALSQLDRGDGVLVRLWQTDDWSAPRRELHGRTSVVVHVAFSPDGRQLASSSQSGQLCVWDLDSTALVYDFRHDDSLRGVAFAPDGRRLAVGCRDYLVYVHDLTAGTVRSLRGHTGIVADVAWSPDGERLASLGDDASIRFWAPAAPTVPRTSTLQASRDGDYGQLQWSLDSERLAASLESLAAGTFDLRTGNLSPEFEVRVAGARLVARPTTGELQLGTGTPQQVPPFRFVEANATGELVAIAQGYQQIWMWDRSTGAPAAQPFPVEVRGLAWLGPAHYVVADGFDRLSIVEARSGTVQRVRPVAECTLAVAANAAGDRVAIGCVDQAVRLWSPATDTTEVLRGHTGHVHAVAFAPNGRRLASGGRDRTVRIWDTAAAAEVMALPVTGRIVALAWSPDGTRLGALLANGQILVWDARPIAPR